MKLILGQHKHHSLLFRYLHNLEAPLPKNEIREIGEF